MYTVPIITTDLRHEETIIQAACALECLQQTIDKIFDKLDERITTNNENLRKLARRIELATNRIQSLTNVKTAIKIYAPSRYPGQDILQNIPTTFNQQNIKTITPKYVVKSKLDVNKDMQDKLLFFHVRDTLSKAPMPILHKQYNSLGPPPLNLHSSAALLRFNSDQIAYFQSSDLPQLNATMPDNWRRAKLLENQKQLELNKRKRQQLLEPAPHSLLNRNQRITPAAELRYTPQLNEPPIIDMPMDLPTLSGVAQNIRFEGNLLQENIHPIIKEEEEKENKLKDFEIKVDINIESISSNPSVVVPVAPQPTPPPPPPPPLPPPALPVASPIVVVDVNPIVEKISDNNNDTRSALMDAIRNAGGARGGKLRAAAVTSIDGIDNPDIVKNKSDKNTIGKKSNGGDLMADLHHKLLMRRKGISGVNSVENNLNNNIGNKNLTMDNPVAQRLSALIPPPPPPTTTTTTTDTVNSKNNTEDDDDDWS